jgi:myo-inositol-1(or 4)-monophosphatase
MCYVANGSADAYYESGIHCWDIAAGTLIAREAGCFVSDLNGCELDILKRRVLCASTQELAEQLLPLIKPVPYEFD